MKVLIMGGGGMLGHKLAQIWQTKFDLWTTVRADFETYEKFRIFDRDKLITNVKIEDIKSVESILHDLKPDVIVNAIGIIKQLPTVKQTVNTLLINSVFPHQLSEIANVIGARLITISTDCVFNGEKGNYNESDHPNAFDLYGKSKNLGEVAAEKCLTLRTSIIGRELQTAHGLVEWFLSNRGGTVRGFSRAIFSGFPTVILADLLANLIENFPALSGLYHVSSAPINKLDLLELIKQAYQIEIDIEPFADFEIDRSLDSSRFRTATGFEPPNWNRMIELMAADDDIYTRV